jgi:hypothetical protein
MVSHRYDCVQIHIICFQLLILGVTTKSHGIKIITIYVPFQSVTCRNKLPTSLKMASRTKDTNRVSNHDDTVENLDA